MSDRHESSSMKQHSMVFNSEGIKNAFNVVFSLD